MGKGNRQVGTQTNNMHATSGDSKRAGEVGWSGWFRQAVALQAHQDSLLSLTAAALLFRTQGCSSQRRAQSPSLLPAEGRLVCAQPNPMMQHPASRHRQPSDIDVMSVSQPAWRDLESRTAYPGGWLTARVGGRFH